MLYFHRWILPAAITVSACMFPAGAADKQHEQLPALSQPRFEKLFPNARLHRDDGYYTLMTEDMRAAVFFSSGGRMAFAIVLSGVEHAERLAKILHMEAAPENTVEKYRSTIRLLVNVFEMNRVRRQQMSSEGSCFPSDNAGIVSALLLGPAGRKHRCLFSGWGKAGIRFRYVHGDEEITPVFSPKGNKVTRFYFSIDGEPPISAIRHLAEKTLHFDELYLPAEYWDRETRADARRMGCERILATYPEDDRVLVKLKDKLYVLGDRDPDNKIPRQPDGNVREFPDTADAWPDTAATAQTTPASDMTPKPVKTGEKPAGSHAAMGVLLAPSREEALKLYRERLQGF